MTELRETRERGSAEVGAGAMTSAMRAVAHDRRSRALRWALVRDARIVCEAIAPTERAVTIGAAGDVPCSDVRERTLAWFEGGRWRMRVSTSWSGRISDRALADRIAGQPRDEDGWVELTLEDDTRARIVIGEHALLVQLVDRPLGRAKRDLPPALQGGFFQRADWMFTAFVAASFILHFAFVIGLIEADWPVETALIPSRYAEPIFIDEVPPPDPPVERMMSDATETPPETDQPNDDTNTTTPPSRDRVRSSHPPRRTQAVADADTAAREAGLAANLLIAGRLANRQGAMTDLIEDGATMPNAARVLGQADGVEVGDSRPGMIGERGGSNCRACPDDGSLRGLRASGHGTGPVREGRPVEEVVITIVPHTPEPEGPLPPGFDTRELIRALRARMPAVQRCYEHELTRGNPDTGGRLTIAITVMPVGTVANLSADENETGSDALAACTIRSLRNTRVRVGPSEPVEVRYPIVFRRPG